VHCVTEEQLHVVRLERTVDVSSTDKMLKCFRSGSALRVSRSHNTPVTWWIKTNQSKLKESEWKTWIKKWRKSLLTSQLSMQNIMQTTRHHQRVEGLVTKKDFNRKHKTTLKAFFCIWSVWPLSPTKSNFPQHWPRGQGYRCKDRVWNQVLGSHRQRVGKWRQCEPEITVLIVLCLVIVIRIWIVGGWGQSFKEMLWFQYMLSVMLQTNCSQFNLFTHRT